MENYSNFANYSMSAHLHHVRVSLRLVALTFSLNVIVCNNLMLSVSLLWLTNFSTTYLHFLLSSWHFYHLVDYFHIQSFFSYASHHVFVYIYINSWILILTYIYIYIDLIIELHISSLKSYSEYMFRQKFLIVNFLDNGIIFVWIKLRKITAVSTITITAVK